MMVDTLAVVEENNTDWGTGILGDLLTDDQVTEILVNGPAEIWAEREGRLSREALAFPNEADLRHWVRKFLSDRGRKVDQAAPFADCTLPDGSRVHVAGPPIARAGLCVSIRKFPLRAWTLPALVSQGSVSPAMAEYLREMVKQKKNIFLSGGTGTGKTSLLGALLAEVGAHERIVALEDISELRTDHPHFLSLEARPPNQEGEGEIGLTRLLRESLRMRPDRLVIGECRGAEALDLLLALNTGHGGSFGTVHANSPRDALQRLETLAMLGGEGVGERALQNLIVGGVHVIVQLERTSAGRKIASVAEVKGIDGDRFLLRDITRP